MKTFLLTLALMNTLASAANAPMSDWQPAQDCRANIAAVTCRVAPLGDDEGKENESPKRACLGGESVYVTALEKVHDDLPPKLQKIFCNLRKIYIEDQFYATGYAGSYQEIFEMDGVKYGRSNGLVLGLSKVKVFEMNLSMTDWMNHKEQTLFGRKFEDPVPAEIPKFTFTHDGIQADPLLLDTVIHEFGHLMDFVNHVNRRDASKCFDPDGNWIPNCEPEPVGAWAAIGWTAKGEVRVEDRFYGDTRPCYYDCKPEETMPLETANDFYKNFLAYNSFVTTYSAASPMEDWAETFHFSWIKNFYNVVSDDNTRSVSIGLALNDSPQELIYLTDYPFLNSGRVRAKIEMAELFNRVEWNYNADQNQYYPIDPNPKAMPRLPALHICNR